MTLYQVPLITAGSRAVASAIGVTQLISKVNSTTRTSNVTITDDPDLSFPVVSGGIYLVEWGIYYSGLTAASINTQWDVPSGSSGLKAVLGPGSSASDSNADNISGRFGVHGYTTSIKYSCARNGTNQQFATENSVVTAGSTGNIALMWAQAVSNATGTVVSGNSWGRCTRMA
jgi:hypothetical protein